jgi:hypothetical protein
MSHGVADVTEALFFACSHLDEVVFSRSRSHPSCSDCSDVDLTPHNKVSDPDSSLPPLFFASSGHYLQFGQFGRSAGRTDEGIEWHCQTIPHYIDELWSKRSTDSILATRRWLSRDAG